MLTGQKLELLQAFLGSLPENLAARLARAVEIDRLTDGAVLPHDIILQGLRPALRRAGNFPRTPTPLRLFCRPFEEMLTSQPRKQKQKGRIARTSVAPVWNWLSRSLLPEETAAYVKDIKTLVLQFKLDEARQRATQFWTLAADKIRAAIATEQGRKSVREILNGDLVVADAEEIALLISVAPRILEIQDALPKPVPFFNEELLWKVRDLHDALIQERLEAAPYVAVIAMNRLARPWEALKLPMMVSRQTQDTLIASTDMGLVGELLFSDIDTLSAAIHSTRHPKFDGAQLLGAIRHFAELSSAVVKEIEVRRDGKWGQRLLKDRAAVGGVMDGFMDRAEKELSAALPMKGGTGPKAPDFSRSVDPEKHESALRYIKLVTGCRGFAAAGSFGAKQKDAQDACAAYLRRYNEDLVKEMRTAEGQRRAVIEQQFTLAVELTALLFSGEEADLLRRRGRAAQSAVAA
jgi:hypothetical protein